MSLIYLNVCLALGKETCWLAGCVICRINDNLQATCACLLLCYACAAAGSILCLPVVQCSDQGAVQYNIHKVQRHFLAVVECAPQSLYNSLQPWHYHKMTNYPTSDERTRCWVFSFTWTWVSHSLAIQRTSSSSWTYRAIPQTSCSSRLPLSQEYKDMWLHSYMYMTLYMYRMYPLLSLVVLYFEYCMDACRLGCTRES